MYVQGVSLFVRDSYIPQDSWGLADQVPLARQSLLLLKCVPKQLALPQKPSHLEGECSCDQKPNLIFNRGALKYLLGPYNKHNAQGQASSVVNL